MSTPRRNTSDPRLMRPRLMRPRRFRGGRGFTLVEVMITMLIVAIAAALAAPMLGDTSQTKLREAGKLLAADIGQIQVETLAHGDAPRAIVFKPGQNYYYITLADDPSAVPIKDQRRQEYRITRFGEGRVRQLSGVKIKRISTTDNRLAFGAYGNLDTGSDADVTLVLMCDQYELPLTIDVATGEVAIGKTTVKAAGP